MEFAMLCEKKVMSIGLAVLMQQASNRCEVLYTSVAKNKLSSDHVGALLCSHNSLLFLHDACMILVWLDHAAC